MRRPLPLRVPAVREPRHRPFGGPPAGERNHWLRQEFLPGAFHLGDTVVDVGAIEFIHQELIQQRDQGMAILLISTELEEILNLSDRIVVLYEGEIMGECPGADADLQQLGLMMAGARQSQLQPAQQQPESRVPHAA